MEDKGDEGVEEEEGENGGGGAAFLEGDRWPKRDRNDFSFLPVRVPDPDPDPDVVDAVVANVVADVASDVDDDVPGHLFAPPPVADPPSACGSYKGDIILVF